MPTETTVVVGLGDMLSPIAMRFRRHDTGWLIGRDGLNPQTPCAVLMSKRISEHAQCLCGFVARNYRIKSHPR